MKVIEYGVDFPNRKWGEDRVFFSENIAGVIDGSTPINSVKTKGFQSQAEWLAHSIATNLSNNVVENLPLSCQKIMDYYKNENWLIDLEFKPCAVLSGIQIDENLTGYSIGDCEIAIELDSGEIEIFTDKRIHDYSAKTRFAKAEAIRKGEDYQLAVKKQMEQNKKHMNVNGGYWTIAFDGYFKDEFLKFSYPLSKVKKCLIYSDGFARLFDLSNITRRQIFNRQISIENCMDILRLEEKRVIKNNEVKKQDDASAILIEIP